MTTEYQIPVNWQIWGSNWQGQPGQTNPVIPTPPQSTQTIQPSVEWWFEQYPEQKSNDISLENLWEPHNFNPTNNNWIDFDLWPISQNQEMQTENNEIFGWSEENFYNNSNQENLNTTNSEIPEINFPKYEEDNTQITNNWDIFWTTNIEEQPQVEKNFSEIDNWAVFTNTQNLETNTSQNDKELNNNIDYQNNQNEEINKTTDTQQENYLEKADDSQKVETDHGLKNTFNELSTQLQEIYQISNLGEWDSVKILWADNDKVRTTYEFYIENWKVSIWKTSLDIPSNEETYSDLAFELENDSLKIYIEWTLLFDEKKDLMEEKRKKQVIDKINKMQFLLQEHKEKVEQESDRKRLIDNFKSF